MFCTAYSAAGTVSLRISPRWFIARSTTALLACSTKLVRPSFSFPAACLSRASIVMLAVTFMSSATKTATEGM